MRVLVGDRGEAGGVEAVRVLHFAPPLAVGGMEKIAQNGEGPGLEVRARLETIDMGKRPHDRVLDEIVRPVDVAGQRDGEGAQARHHIEQSLADLRIGHGPVLGPTTCPDRRRKIPGLDAHARHADTPSPR
jgi:hypothetical protein